jgi:hypothetical protein
VSRTGSISHRPKRQRRVPGAVSGERAQARRDHRSLVDRRLVDFLEVAQQPACGDARVPTRIRARDQDRQLQRLFKTESPELPGGRFGDDEVAVRECSAKDRARMPLRGRRSSSLGAGTARRCYASESATGLGVEPNAAFGICATRHDLCDTSGCVRSRFAAVEPPSTPTRVLVQRGELPLSHGP